MTEEQAIDLMVRQAFQEEDEARAKWLRARLTSTQLSTYYVGALEMWTWRSRRDERAAVAAGARRRDRARRSASPAASGRRPGFDYRPHLESVISHGSPPIKWVAGFEEAG